MAKGTQMRTQTTHLNENCHGVWFRELKLDFVKSEDKSITFYNILLKFLLY